MKLTGSTKGFFLSLTSFRKAVCKYHGYQDTVKALTLHRLFCGLREWCYNISFGYKKIKCTNIRAAFLDIGWQQAAGISFNEKTSSKYVYLTHRKSKLLDKPTLFGNYGH